VDAALTLRAARRASGLTQAQLASRTGTSQATVSAYENGRKQPSLDTLARLLAAAGWRLALEPEPRVVARSEEDHARAGRVLADVMALAEALPVRHQPELRFPRLRARAG
jgi:transcriptional regulator with XRE-family HTH domain